MTFVEVRQAVETFTTILKIEYLTTSNSLNTLCYRSKIVQTVEFESKKYLNKPVVEIESF